MGAVVRELYVFRQRGQPVSCLFQGVPHCCETVFFIVLLGLSTPY